MLANKRKIVKVLIDNSIKEISKESARKATKERLNRYKMEKWI